MASGYSVETARNGQEALAQLSGEKMPDLILLDMKMPVMDGWQFAAEFDRRYGRAAPIVVLTAAADAGKRAAEVRADGCVVKPFQLDDLLAVIRDHAA